MARWLTLGAISLGTFGAVLFLFPPDSDATLAASDPVYYGYQVERLGRGAINGHHPLFHAVVLAIAGALSPLAVAHPGPTALRIAAAVAAALIVALVFRGAGRGRWYVGAGFALLLLATRSFLFEAGVGESIVPGCAAALFAIDQATRAPRKLLRVWGSLVLALLVRQDNVLIVPGVVLGLWLVLEPRGRVTRLVMGVLGSAAVTLAGYAVLWQLATAGDRPFGDFMLGLSLDPQYADPDAAWDPRWHVDALGAAVVGRTWQPWTPNLWVGPAFLAATLGAGFLLRGRDRMRPVTAAVAGVVLVRALFYTWFDNKNWEWSVLTLVLFAWLGSRMAGGQPLRARSARTCGAALLIGLSAAVLSAHARLTWSLRAPTLVDAVRQAVAAGDGCRFIAVGHTPDLALDFLGVHHVLVPTPRSGDLVETVTREVKSRPGPAMVVIDRWVYDGEPHSMINQRDIPIFIDWMQSTSEVRILRWRDRAYAVRYDPPPK